MSGHRSSGFDPNGVQQPLNGLQRAGIACLFLGAAIVLAYIAGALGLVPKMLDSPVLGTAFCALAAPLISWRGRGSLSPETKRQRLLLILTAVILCAVAATLAFILGGRHG
jgi:hypothetical protein